MGFLFTWVIINPSFKPASLSLPFSNFVTFIPYSISKFRLSLLPTVSKLAPKTVTLSRTICVSPCLLRKVTVNCFLSPFLFTTIFTSSPGRKRLTFSCNSAVELTGSPAYAHYHITFFQSGFARRTISVTAATKTPSNLSRPFSSAKEPVTSIIFTPRSARCTSPNSLRSATTFCTMETGTAKEYPE
jgi:hypothetical protein